MKDLRITHQQKCISIKSKIELHSKIESGYCPEVLTPKTMKLLESAQQK